MQVTAALRRALDDFFGSKKSRLPRRLLEGCLRAHPRAAPQLLPDVLARAAAARTPFLRAEALALLAQMLRPPRVRRLTHLVHPVVVTRRRMPSRVAAFLQTLQENRSAARAVCS